MRTGAPNRGSGEKKEKIYRKVYGDFAPYLTLGFQLAAAVVLFFLLGHWIDKKFDLDPIGKLVGALFGSIGGFIKFFKTVSALDAEKKEQKNDKV